MRWMRFRIRTTSEAEDILVSSMQDIGLYGAQIEDHVPLTAAEKEQMFVDIMPEEQPDDGSAVLSFFVEEEEDSHDAGQVRLLIDEERVTPEVMKSRIEDKIAELKAYSDVIGDGTVTIEETEDIDWVNNWKQYFHQFWIDDILVIPSWEKPAQPELTPALTFHIDPGTAFGTGAHETTQLCIREIRRYLTSGTELLDVGTGSGILSILSLMLGAKYAVGTDLDPCAPPAIHENMETNHIDPAKFKVILGNLVDDPNVQDEVGYEKYDIVVANILPKVLAPLMPAGCAALKKGGIYITSGIIDGAEGEVEQAMTANGLELVRTTTQGEWHCVVGRKPM